MSSDKKSDTGKILRFAVSSAMWVAAPVFVVGSLGGCATANPAPVEHVNTGPTEIEPTEGGHVGQVEPVEQVEQSEEAEPPVNPRANPMID